MFYSWWLRRTPRWQYDLSHPGSNHSSSMFTDRDSTILLLDMDARVALYKTVGAKTVCYAPHPSISAADPSLVSSASSL